MPTEFEITITDIDLPQIVSVLQKQGAILHKPKTLYRRNTCMLKTNPAGAYHWIRIRDEQDKTVMTYKRKSIDQAIDGQKEIEVIVNDFSTASALVDALDIGKMVYEENFRQIWHYNNCEICIDEWPWLSPFVEIEGADQDTIMQTAALLGFDNKAISTKNAGDLYLEKYHKHPKDLSGSRVVFGDTNPFLD